MSTSLLYHAFGIRGDEYVRTEYRDGGVTFNIRQEPKTFRCGACGSRDVRPKGRVPRRFRSLPIGFPFLVFVLLVRPVAADDEAVAALVVPEPQRPHRPRRVAGSA